MAFYKRVLNELNNKIPHKMSSINLANKFTFVSLDTDIVSKKFGIVNNYSNKIELQLTIPSEYPFKPPNVLVLNNDQMINYDRWSVDIINKKNITCNLFYAWAFSVIRRPNLLHFWHQNIPNLKECLCCQSLISCNNWIPSRILCDILAEYVTRRDFKNNCKPLLQRLINPIFDNDKWVIPDDIILLIISKL